MTTTESRAEPLTTDPTAWLRAEVAELRAELFRMRAEMASEIRKHGKLISLEQKLPC